MTALKIIGITIIVIAWVVFIKWAFNNWRNESKNKETEQ
jgi:hypothetical protein